MRVADAIETLDRRIVPLGGFGFARERRQLLADVSVGGRVDPDQQRRARRWAERILDPAQRRRIWISSAVTTVLVLIVVLLVKLLTTSSAATDALYFLPLVPLLSTGVGLFVAREEARDLLRVLPAE